MAAPAAPPASAGNAVIVPAPPQKPLPAPTTTINVSQMPKGDPSPIRSNPKLDQMKKDLRQKFGGEQPALPPNAPKEASSPAEAPPRPGAEPAEDSPSLEETSMNTEAGSPNSEPASSPPAETAPATTGKDGKKVSPWKLVDQFKARATAAEARALELEKQVLPEAKRKELTESLDSYKKRVEEMEGELRYHNAEKYDPDIKAANTAYETAWKRALSELSEITVSDPASGTNRPVTDQDLVDLVNLPLGKAREIADQYFGVFADDVMAHRKEIRNLFESKSAKLKELKESGGKRDQERQTQYQTQMEGIQKQVKEIYEQANQEATSHEKFGVYFKEREGDTEWNNRLTKGFEMVDKAFSENSMDPRLTPEQRAAIVKRHAAVRNRAASWGALRYQNEQLTAKIAALEKDLAGYSQSTPPAGGSNGNTPSSPLKGMDAIRAGLQRIGKPI